MTATPAGVLRMDGPSGWPAADELAELVRHAQSTAPRAIDLLLETLRPPILERCARRLPSDLAEDCAQTVLIRIARALPRIDPPRAERYIHRIAGNALRTARRQAGIDARRRAPLDDVIDQSAPNPHLAEGERAESVQMLRDAVIAGLPSPLRELVLDLFAGHSTNEIAARQHVSPITIRTRLLRARVLLHEHLRASTSERANRPRYQQPTMAPIPVPPPSVVSRLRTGAARPSSRLSLGSCL